MATTESFGDSGGRLTEDFGGTAAGDTGADQPVATSRAKKEADSNPDQNDQGTGNESEQVNVETADVESNEDGAYEHKPDVITSRKK